MIIYHNDRFSGGREESRRLLGEAFTAYTGDAERAQALLEALRKGEHGKPYAEGFSCFSVSHTGNIWAVLICGRECGLDIQLGRDADVRALSERWFSPEDAAYIADAAEEKERKDRFFRVWTRREALVKALGGSVYETELPAVSGDKAAVEGRTYSVAEISLPGTIALPEEDSRLYTAVCLEGDEIPADITYIPVF